MSRGAEHRRRLRRHESPHDARFLTFSCYRRLPLFGNDRIKDAFVHELGRTREALGFLLTAYVVMPEHVHLILKPAPTASVSRINKRLKAGFAHQVLARWRTLRAPILPRVQDGQGAYHFWQQGGGYDRNLITPEEYWEKLAYVHDNPVRRGLVSRPLDWRWSSAQWYDGDKDKALLAIDAFKP